MCVFLFPQALAALQLRWEVKAAKLRNHQHQYVGPSTNMIVRDHTRNMQIRRPKHRYDSARPHAQSDYAGPSTSVTRPHAQSVSTRFVCMLMVLLSQRCQLFPQRCFVWYASISLQMNDYEEQNFATMLDARERHPHHSIVTCPLGTTLAPTSSTATKPGQSLSAGSYESRGIRDFWRRQRSPATITLSGNAVLTLQDRF